MRPETVEIISSPARKPASKSDFSSSISSTSDNEYYAIGADSPISELSFEGGYLAIDKWRTRSRAAPPHKARSHVHHGTDTSRQASGVCTYSDADYRQLGPVGTGYYFALASLKEKPSSRLTPTADQAVRKLRRGAVARPRARMAKRKIAAVRAASIVHAINSSRQEIW